MNFRRLSSPTFAVALSLTCSLVSAQQTAATAQAYPDSKFNLDPQMGKVINRSR